MPPVHKKKYVIIGMTALALACTQLAPDKKAAAIAIQACVERNLFDAAATGAAIPSVVAGIFVDECHESSPGIATCVARIEITAPGGVRTTTTVARYLLQREGGEWVARISTSH